MDYFDGLFRSDLGFFIGIHHYYFTVCQKHVHCVLRFPRAHAHPLFAEGAHVGPSGLRCARNTSSINKKVASPYQPETERMIGSNRKTETTLENEV